MLGCYVVTAETVLKADIVPHGVYRLTVHREDQTFTFTLWNETDGRDKRMAAALQIACGISKYESTGYIEPSS